MIYLFFPPVFCKSSLQTFFSSPINPISCQWNIKSLVSVLALCHCPWGEMRGRLYQKKCVAKETKKFKKKMGTTNSSSRDEPEREDRRDGTGEVYCNDPRSPSNGVSRTPLRLTEPWKQQQQSIDPRSPSGCVERTPIKISQLKVHSETMAVKKDATPPERLALNYENVPPKQDKISSSQ